jgi:hypothetical protein
MGLSNRVPMRLARPHAMKDIAGIVGVGGRVGVTGSDPEFTTPRASFHEITKTN